MGCLLVYILKEGLMYFETVLPLCLRKKIPELRRMGQSTRNTSQLNVLQSFQFSLLKCCEMDAVFICDLYG